MQVLRLVEIQLAEDFLSEGAREWVPETWKYMKFMQFWSSLQVSWLYGRINSCLENFVFFRENDHYLVKSAGLTAIRTNKFLSGEFHVFHGKVVIIGFGHHHGDLAVN